MKGKLQAKNQTVIKSENSIHKLNKEFNKAFYNTEIGSKSKSKLTNTPKCSMKDILSDNLQNNNFDLTKSSKNLIKKKQSETDFNPKYNSITVSDIKNKMNKQSAYCFNKKINSTETNLDNNEYYSTTGESNPSIPKSANASIKVADFKFTKPSKVKVSEDLFEDLNHKEKRIKSMYPELSKEEIKLLMKSKETNKVGVFTRNSTSNLCADHLNQLAKSKQQEEKSTFSTKTKRLMDNGSNIFNCEVKQSLNKKFFEKMEVNKQKEENNVVQSRKNVFDRPSISNNKKTEIRAKSAKERKIETLTSSIFIDESKNFAKITALNIKSKADNTKTVEVSDKENKEKVEKLIRSKSQFFKSSKQNSVLQNVSYLQGSKFIQNAICKIEAGNTLEKHYNITNIKDSTSSKEIKQKLAMKGIHVSKIDYKYNLLQNNDVNSMTISLRTNPNDNNVLALKKFFIGSKISELTIDEKPFLKKPKTDIISGKLNFLDTKLSEKYKNKDLESTRNKDAPVYKLTR